jgi:hypothetical protein
MWKDAVAGEQNLTAGYPGGCARNASLVILVPLEEVVGEVWAGVAFPSMLHDGRRQQRSSILAHSGAGSRKIGGRSPNLEAVRGQALPRRRLAKGDHRLARHLAWKIRSVFEEFAPSAIAHAIQPEDDADARAKAASTAPPCAPCDVVKEGLHLHFQHPPSGLVGSAYSYCWSGNDPSPPG